MTIVIFCFAFFNNLLSVTRRSSATSTEDQGNAWSSATPRARLSLPMCAEKNAKTANGRFMYGPQIPPSLRPWRNQSFVKAELGFLSRGGCWRPSHCRSLGGGVAFIFVTDGSEERTTQLNFVLYHLLPKLKDQKLDFCVYLAVQNSARSARDEFNKGALINAAFVEAMADRHWDCVCLHDVDLVVQGNTNLYSCPSDHVRHLVSGVDRWLWQLPYEELAGGASVIMSEHFRLINGLSTAYWGWGGEDDDFFTRVKHSNLTWQRSPWSHGLHRHLHHTSYAWNRKGSPENRFLLANSKQLQMVFGLTTLQYELIEKNVSALFTRLEVGVPEQEPSVAKLKRTL